MQHYRLLESIQLSDSWVTIGTFDGVHRGHQAIIEKVVTGARETGTKSVVITFHPHPADVLGKRNGPRYLTTPEDRAQELGALGIDYVITLTFDRALAELSAQEFMARCVRHLGISQLVVGHDFALGHGRKGDINALTQLGIELGYKVVETPQIIFDGMPVSSSLIRAKLSEGDVSYAANLLGRYYKLSGIVVHGDDRGRTIGIPTANLQIDSSRVIPRPGVYAVHVMLNNQRLPAVVNIGFRPTFERQALDARVEAHILEFDADIYGKELSIEFIEYLREEQRFPGIQALVEQIHVDINRAKQILVKE